MGLSEDVTADIEAIIKGPFDPTNGTVVPESENVALLGGAVKLDATLLYADLADSTQLAMDYKPYVASETIKCFLAACTRIIRAFDGEIRSFDGDRVMAVFLGKSKNTNAAKCAFRINRAIQYMLKPTLEAQYPELATGTYRIAHGVGIDTGVVYAVRAGIRGNNDLIWVGRAPNVAAKLCNLRSAPYFTYITGDVYTRLADEAKVYNGRQMWEEAKWAEIPSIKVYRSSWWWKL